MYLSTFNSTWKNEFCQSCRFKRRSISESACPSSQPKKRLVSCLCKSVQSEKGKKERLGSAHGLEKKELKTKKIKTEIQRTKKIHKASLATFCRASDTDSTSHWFVYSEYGTLSFLTHQGKIIIIIILKASVADAVFRTYYHNTGTFAAY